MTYRDRAIVRYFLETIWKSPLGVYLACSIGAGLTLGLLGALFAGHPSKPNKLKNVAVFSAAPISFIDVVPENRGFKIANSPPPYSKVALLKLHRRHKIPSTRCVKPSIPTSSILLPRNGGTTGTPPVIVTAPGGLFGSCAKVEVWFPTSDMEIAPTMKDPNAMVIFRISPPTELSGCGAWTYHYGASRL
jgi:hypothetical protein